MMKRLGLLAAFVLGLFAGVTHAAPSQTEAFILFYKADGSYLFEDSPRWQLSPEDWPTEWTKWEIGSFTTPAGVTDVDFNLVSWEGNRPLGTGIAYDDASITEAGSAVNLLLNPGFEVGASSLPDDWTADSSNGGVVAEDVLWVDDPAGAYSGDKYMKLLTNENANGNGTEPYFWPESMVPVEENTTYDFSVWARSLDVPIPEPSTLILAGLGLLGLTFRRRR